MSFFYSAATGGFYHSNIHPDRPADAVAVTPVRHRELLDAQADGRRIVAGPTGRPILERRKPWTVDQQRTRLLLSIRKEADHRCMRIASPARRLADAAAVARHALAVARAEATAEDSVPTAAVQRVDGILSIEAAADRLVALVVAVPPVALASIDPSAEEHWS